MPTKQKSAMPSFQQIDGSILGEYAVVDYQVRVYSKVYYAIRELSGLVAKRSLKELFDWNEFKERFTNDFGKVQEKRYSLEQLLEYASRKFGKTLDELIAQNQISWQRRQQYAERTNITHQSEIIDETNCF
ncbi:hypothetical protein DSM106972_047610 [Dulcicalothrix desertica PCC 7102]|uniref:Uncharacterized protein n=1 Tax=Dulcicalothrix desertica PCC 7102 TaxID=232991 RepID=A0A433VCR8_9CYAN|nr:hypothetical protein [Dulcicalothrix desertica]RUT03847.1 hypothetical protein DSM106972_047610 [Dulcicalothrix desertica PCC 7102]TWH43742.1 hypothetical protein CAL7102_07486 [Dulcicalothrix desertica PCC 7102]